MPTPFYRAVEAAARTLRIQEPYRQGIDKAIAHVAKVNEKAATPPAAMMRRFDVSKRMIAGSAVYVFRSKVTPPERRILFIHGGGGMMRATSFHYAFLTRLVLQTHAEVWMPFYPLAPDPTFFDSLSACYGTYRAMLSEPADLPKLPVFFVGDSAGANLELATCRRALDEGAEKPRGIVCISPATGFEDPAHHEKFAAQERTTRDPLLCAEMLDDICDNMKWAAAHLRFNGGFGAMRSSRMRPAAMHVRTPHYILVSVGPRRLGGAYDRRSKGLRRGEGRHQQSRFRRVQEARAFHGG